MTWNVKPSFDAVPKSFEQPQESINNFLDCQFKFNTFHNNMSRSIYIKSNQSNLTFEDNHNDSKNVHNLKQNDDIHVSDHNSEINQAETNTVTRCLEALTTEASPLAISTLVFCDIETTGLANLVGKKNVQITEISMIAVDRNEFCVCSYPDLRDARIVHKISLCVRPQSFVSKDAAKLTGLSDQNLKNQEPFDENTASAIISFLKHLQKPICMLAHNGKLFDFPVIKAEFLKLNIQLPSDIYIADTLVSIRSIGIPDLPFSQKLHKDVKFKKNSCISYSLSNLHLYFFGKQYLGCHSSEGDCIALAKVCHKLKEKIIPWIDENYSTFDSIKPMW